MITLLTGENSFEVARALRRIRAAFDGTVEQVDGSELEVRQLPDLLMGGTLFSDKRMVVIKGLSENKSVWNSLVDWIPRVSDDVHLVVVEAKPDKRTVVYKDLKKVADVQEFAAWTDRDSAKAEQWLAGEAKAMGMELDRKSIQTLVRRVGVDQWSLYHEMEKLAVLETVDAAVIEQLVEAAPTENVFNLFDAALRGQARDVKEMILVLQATEDPYKVFGLLSSQVFQLAALAVSDKPSAEVAADIGAHPFAMGKLTSHAKRLGRPGARAAVAVMAEVDDGMKTSGGEPWLLIERGLIKIAAL